MSVIESRVENRRSNCSLPVDIRRGFRRATSVRFGLVLFPVPAHRTGLADFPHPALGKDSRFRPRKGLSWRDISAQVGVPKDTLLRHCEAK